MTEATTTATTADTPRAVRGTASKIVTGYMLNISGFFPVDMKSLDEQIKAAEAVKKAIAGDLAHLIPMLTDVSVLQKFINKRVPLPAPAVIEGAAESPNEPPLPLETDADPELAELPDDEPEDTDSGMGHTEDGPDETEAVETTRRARNSRG